MSKTSRWIIWIILSLLVFTKVVIADLPMGSNTTKKPATVATATVAPVATATVAPVATATVAPVATATVAPVATATVAPATATVAPATATVAPATTTATAPATAVTSAEVSKAAILSDAEGNFRTAMIFESELSKVNYTEIEISVWNGIYILANSEGIVGEIFGKEAKADSQLRAGQRDEKLIKNFFVDGKVLSQKAREGYAVAGTTVGFYQNLTNVKFVKLEGENHYRLVVIGKATNKGGNSKTTAKPAPTATPRIPEEAATPRIPEATMPPEEVATPRIPDMDMPTEDSATAAGGDDVAEPSIGGEDSSDWDI